MDKEFSGTLRIANVKTLDKWKVTGKYQELINEGFMYAKGCGRFRKEICTCNKCRKSIFTEQEYNEYQQNQKQII